MITTYTDKIGRVGMAPFGKPHTVMAGPGGKVRVARWKTSFEGDPNPPEYACFNTHRQCVGHTKDLDVALVFLQTGRSPRRQRTIVLTKKQWRAFDRDVMDDPKRSALQSCCGNIGTLREDIFSIRANRGELTPELLANLKEHWAWCVDGHTFDDVKFPSIKPLRSLIEQAGLEWPRVTR